MTKVSNLASKIFIKVGGSEVQRPVMQNILEVVVDQHCHMPDMFMIRLNDRTLSLIDEGPFDLTKEIEIAAKNGEGETVLLIKGEITALEPEFEEGMMAVMVVRGYDKSHRLYREVKSKAFLNIKDSDLAQQIAQTIGLQAEVETTSQVYEHVFQHNQSDLAFLMQRAWRIGFECFVEDDKLHFGPPAADSSQATLAWGDNLLSFRPRMTLGEQVDEVIVRGWDVDKQEAIVGKAENGRLYPQIEKSAADQASQAGQFGAGRWVVVDQPVVSQAEADTLAAARMDEISGAFLEAEGVAFRAPEIKAGKMVTLEKLGKRFSGSYLVTSASHIYTAEGLRTTFAVRGARTGLLLQQTQGQPLDRWPGVALAVVTNTQDPQDWGRVKVKFPWLSDEAESDWARVIGIGAGPEAGYYILPEVGDEVLVGFGLGDFSQPFVIGGLWNGQHKLPPEAANAADGEKPLVRTWHSRSGHWIAMYDNADKKMELVTQGEHRLVLDDANQKITFQSSGGSLIELDDSGRKVTIKSGGDIEVKAEANLKISAGANMDLEATGQVNVKGKMINLG